MKIKKQAFTLVELLVVITIIAILGVVAYTQFGGATDKAKATTKLGDMNAIKGALTQFKTKYNKYLPTGTYDATNNMWGYTSGAAKKTNDLTVAKSSDGVKIESITSADGGGDVTDKNGVNIGKKGVFEYDGPIKEFLKSPAYDRQVGDIELTSGAKLIDSGIGKYVYATYKGESAYNLAYTIKDKNGVEVTKIVGDYNEYSCANNTDCPATLIGPGGNSLDVLKDGDAAPNIPYKLDF